MIRETVSELIESVHSGNLRLVDAGLVLLTFGNVSAMDRGKSVVAIKPSGVAYSTMGLDDIVLCDPDGIPIESKLRPSSDLPTHLELYRAFPEIGAVVHTHSTFASAFAQARRGLPCLGTTHADFFYGGIPVTDPMNAEDIAGDYEANTGAMISGKFKESGINARQCPAVLVADHGPFCWGESAEDAVENAIVLEEIARAAWLTLSLSKDAPPVSRALLDKHYFRKHGAGSYYGQQ